jgi:hypothetical protein
MNNYTGCCLIWMPGKLGCLNSSNSEEHPLPAVQARSFVVRFRDIADHVNRHIAFVICLRLLNVLARIYAHHLFLPRASQIWDDC